MFNNPDVHFINDILLVIKVALDYKIKIKTIINKIKNFKITQKRMNIIKLKDNILINDCYNASLESIQAGINYLKNIKENKILIIGDILELGKYSKRIHKKVNKKTVGKYSKYIKGIQFNDVDELINYIEKEGIKESYIYVKGSRRMNLDKIVDYIQTR